MFKKLIARLKKQSSLLERLKFYVINPLKFTIKHPIDVLLAPFYFLLAIFLRLFTKIKHHHIDAKRVGHLCCEVEYYLAKKNIYGLSGESHIFTHSALVANKLILKKFANNLFILPFSSTGSFFFSKILPPVAWNSVLDAQGNILKTNTSVVFTKKEIIKAKLIADKIGIDTNKPIVLIFNRDSLYLEKHFGSKENSYSYHDYRDFPISDMYEATKAMTDLGYHVVRVGRYFKDKAEFDLDDFTDYTICKPSDLLEMYLFSICKFVIGTPSGLYQMATLFRKPVVFTNMAPILNLFYQKSTKYDIFIPQKYKCLSTNAVLSSSDIKNIGAETIFLSEKFLEKDIALERNTANEIKFAAIEMHERLNNSIDNNEELYEKQRKFQSILAPDLLFIIKKVFGKCYKNDNHPIWEELENNLSYKKAFPEISQYYLKNNSWLYN